jgi:hypothetical protein
MSDPKPARPTTWKRPFIMLGVLLLICGGVLLRECSRKQRAVHAPVGYDPGRADSSLQAGR